MRPNRLRQIWADGKPVINAWCNMPGAFVAEAVASQGWDAVTIDTQHGLIGYDVMVAMLQAVTASGVTPLVRVSWNAPGEIMKALDAGAYGVICPMINNRAECEAFIKAARYPPLGQRSFGPIRAALVAGPGYPEESNGEILTFAMIETAEGLEKADEITTTPGLDGVYIGPSDLSLSLGGKPLQDNDDPKILAAFERIVASCKKAGIKAGVHTSSVGYSQKMIAMGFDLVTVGADMRWLMSGRREALQMREHIDGKPAT
jgi:4-hydroxy-2-oxoheptanedioate aldolase